MKLLSLFFFLFTALAVQAQTKPSLKDLLYSGKLKKDSSGVIRSSDDLASKIDTAARKESAAPAPVVAKNDTLQKSVNRTDSLSTAPIGLTEVADSAVVATEAAPVLPAKTNTRLWKEYNDSLQQILKAEVLNSRQVKKNTYYLMAEYEIETNGQVSFINLTSTPENPFLQAQVKQIMDSMPLLLHPATDSNGQPKKVKRRQQIVVVKD